MGDSWEMNITYLIRVVKSKTLLTVGALSRLSAAQRGCWRTKGGQFARKCKDFLKPFVKMGREQFVCVTVFQMLDFLLVKCETLYAAILGLMCWLKPCV